ncbi:hypothetical protein ANN_18648 [Periplaneta americana]|uniref:Uncharacterized protein n=1 Tax=Periplaneta americana TaxID=6978 RepID=A0ABQ8SQQ0_PERAM|nr:hypothetical protein ANN_18648 [Periplaneta americana]
MQYSLTALETYRSTARMTTDCSEDKNSEYLISYDMVKVPNTITKNWLPVLLQLQWSSRKLLAFLTYQTINGAQMPLCVEANGESTSVRLILLPWKLENFTSIASPVIIVTMSIRERFHFINRKSDFEEFKVNVLPSSLCSEQACAILAMNDALIRFIFCVGIRDKAKDNVRKRNQVSVTQQRGLHTPRGT